MTPERWQQIDDLLQDALAQPPAARAAFLAQACDNDAELRCEVASLLRFQPEVEEFLEAPPAEVAAEMLKSSETASLAERALGPYQIERQLGQGGMGVVYLAYDTRLGRPVALKLLPTHLTGEVERVRRFEREAHSVSALNHPNIVTVYDFGQEDGRHYIATEYVAGQTLRAALGDPDFKLTQALDVAMQVASALAAAHQAGIIHRDIKPENVMLRPDGYVKVLDFGLAKLTESRSSGDEDETVASIGSGFKTRTGMVLGTVSYMSPEQAGGQKVDARTDLFSLGVVLYEMVTGHRPFEGRTRNHVLVAILDQEQPSLSSYAAGAPVELESIINQALRKDRAQRYQTAAELLADLRKLKQDLEIQARVESRSAEERLAEARTRASGEQASAPSAVTGPNGARITSQIKPHRRKVVVMLVALLLIAAIIAGVLLLAVPPPTIDSIAVLPFANAGNDPQVEYLPDGITESLIGSLSQLPHLRVMARGTVFTYKGREADPRQVGATLKVRTVVLGRVERRGERLVIGVELVDAADGARLWGEQYQRPLADIFAVQAEIAREIAEQLRVRLSSAEREQLAKRQTTNPEAYQLYLQGRYHYLQFNRASQERALDYFRQAITRDPRYALAYTGIADVYADFSSQYLAPSEAMPQAKQAAAQALELDEQLPEAHHSLAMVKWFGDWDWAGAEVEFRRALALNPNAAATYAFYADFLLRLKRFDEALSQARQGYELDPLSPHGSEMVSKSLFYLRRYDESVAQSRKTLELNPNYIWVGLHISNSRAQQGRHEEAIAEVRRNLELNQHDAILSHLGYLYAFAGRRDEARKVLTELEERARQRRVSPVYRARVYANLGDKERALELLRQAYEERSDHLLAIGIDPIFDGLRADPRFAELLRGIGLPP